MSIEKPMQGVGKKEPISLDSAARHLLEECRMVLPGIQALFGFQLIAVFNEGFSKKLSAGEQALHLAAIVLVAVAVALVMAPAAIHRQTQQREVSERFIWLSSRLLLASMFPLAVALCLDIYLISRVILERGTFSAAIAAILLAVIFTLWIVLPSRERAKHR
jgi:small-conductance mechanosensitive channel